MESMVKIILQKTEQIAEQKAKLLDNLFDLNLFNPIESSTPNTLEFLKESMVDFFREHNCFDIQISNAITLLTIEIKYPMDKRNRINNKDLESTRLAEPVWHRLLYSGLHDYNDIRLAMHFINYMSSIEYAKDIADMALEKLSEYQDESQYDKVRHTIAQNMLKHLNPPLFLSEADYTTTYSKNLNFNQYFEIIFEHGEI